MKKRQRQLYLQPTMDVVWLSADAPLLAGSTGTGSFESDPEEVDME